MAGKTTEKSYAYIWIRNVRIYVQKNDQSESFNTLNENDVGNL